MSSDQFSQNINLSECAGSLMETIPVIMQHIRTEMRTQEDSLSIPQFRVLTFLGRYPGSSLSEVAEHLGVAKATASTMTDRLVKKGFVDRSDRPDERRQVVLKLTEIGKEYVDRRREKTRENIAAMLKNLTAEELAAISTSLTVLNKVFLKDI